MDTNTVLPLHLPVIDFSYQSLKPGSSNWDKVRTNVRKALEDYGCFEASCDKISTELKKSVFKAIEELFELPIETKKRNVCSKPYHGYINDNLFETLGIDDADVVEKVEDFTQQLWPDQGNKTISETIHQFSKKSSEVDLMVRRMIMESFGIEKYIDEHLSSTSYLLRVMKYEVPGSDEKNMGLRTHTDNSFVTILYQHEVEGLEVKTRDEKWIKVKPSQDSFIVLIGDSLAALLNGRLSPPCHRVILTGKETRYSAALFSVPKAGEIVDSPEELVDDEHPRLFKPMDYDNFLKFYHTEFYYTEAGRKGQSALISYSAL